MVLFHFLWFTQWVFSTKHAECFEKQNNYFNTGEKKYLEIKLLKACEEIKFFVVSAHSEYFWEVLITNFWAKVIRCAFVEETGLQYKQLLKKCILSILTFSWPTLHYEAVPRSFIIFKDQFTYCWAKQKSLTGDRTRKTRDCEFQCDM